MENWKTCIITQNKQIVDAVKIIDSSGAKIALVIDEKFILQGTITDYDIRQAILRGENMEQSVVLIMNRQPKTILNTDNMDDIFLKMKKYNVRQLPILNSQRQIVGLKLLTECDTIVHNKKPPVLIMAGGLGSRLRPLTDSCPKPMLKIGNKPILEIILENFIEAGFKKFFLSVNYKKDMIKNYFGDGKQLNISIKYIEEEKRLGTAGALSLLPKGIQGPIIVMNGDLLTKINFQQLLDFHCAHNALATMCVREYRYQIPYGVITYSNWEIKEIKEKPSCSAFVNAGIYVINPEMFSRVKKNTYLDMTDLFNKYLNKDNKVLIFPVREYWLDVGRLEDFERAQEDFL